MKYKLLNHWDVLGNPEDGYEVNNSVSMGCLELESTTDAEILKALQIVGALSGHCNLKLIRIIRCVNIDIYREKDGLPLYSLIEQNN